MIILCNHRKVSFTELQKLLHLTAGNLNFHIEKLKKANYVKTHKSLATGRPKTVIKLTELGEASFKEYIYKFRHILNQL
jgi:DNA-binding MarR family transcriptional regulator